MLELKHNNGSGPATAGEVIEHHLEPTYPETPREDNFVVDLEKTLTATGSDKESERIYVSFPWRFTHYIAL